MKSNRVTSIVDAKGRVALGEKFANKTVILRVTDHATMPIAIVRAIPERESWLFKNSAAKKAVLKGLEQAKAGEFADDPRDLASPTWIR